MKVRTPTSSESARRFIRSIDAVSAILGAPIAMELRDPNVFSGDRLGPTAGYCLIASCATFLMVIVFHLGRSAHMHISAREARSVIAASLAATALTALCAFSINRLDYVPRSLPLIQLLVLRAPAEPRPHVAISRPPSNSAHSTRSWIKGTERGT